MGTSNFTNVTSYNRDDHSTKPFVIYSMSIFDDKRLSNDELLIMLKLLKNSDNYIFNSTYFQKESGLSKNKYYDALYHLIELGYINKKTDRRNVIWTINETPIEIEHKERLKKEKKDNENELIENEPLEESKAKEIANSFKEENKQLVGPVIDPEPIQEPEHIKEEITNQIINNMEEVKETIVSTNEELFSKMETFINTKNNNEFEFSNDAINAIGKYFTKEERDELLKYYKEFIKVKKINRYDVDKIKNELISPIYNK